MEQLLVVSQMDDTKKAKIKTIIATRILAVSMNGSYSVSTRLKHTEELLQIWADIEMKDFIQTLQLLLYHPDNARD